jgi:hypothetical protein
MSRGPVRAIAVAAVALLGLTASACGDAGAPEPSATDPASSPSAQVRDTGTWLLRFTTAGGADGERARAVYVSYDPRTGAATARALPAVTGSDAGQDEQALLVSADHAWAIPDTGVPRSQARTGRLVLYSIAGAATRTLDIRAATGQRDLRARAWAFDPTDADALRVVDADRQVWTVDLTTSRATRTGELPHHPGWIYGNGFDKNTAVPYIESVDSFVTDPAGNGEDDTRPVQRQGGVLVRYDGGDLDGLPDPPCGFAGGFEFRDGDAWLFCADTPSIVAYRLGEGADPRWDAVGTPSPKVVPGGSVELAFALPPVD